MATGPKHYRAAELLLDTARDAEGGGAMERFALAAAQVHATLALAAATALAATNSMPDCDSQDWFKTVTCATGEDDAETGVEAAARENAEHDPRTCTECADQYEAEQEADRDAVETAMSASERFEHDQADEFAQDAADAERWAEENAANQYEDAHYNTDNDEDGEL